MSDDWVEDLLDPRYECGACAIEGQPCDVPAAVLAERSRIIKLLEDSRELRGHIYFWEEFGENDTEGRDRKERAIALIKGEK